MSRYNTFNYQCAEYLGLTGAAQPAITSSMYMPVVSNQTTITVNGATGYSNAIGMCWGTADATLGVGSTAGHFTVSFKPSLYTEVPAVVYSVNGNDDLKIVSASGLDTANDDTTIAVERATSVAPANLKISWMAQSQD